MAALKLLLVLPLLSATPSAPLAPPPLSQAAKDAEERYRFLVGLAEKDLHDLAVKEAQSFLVDYPRHTKRTLVRYRLGNALYALGRASEAAEAYEPLTRERGFEYRAEATFRLGECQLEADDLLAARQSFEAVLRLDQTYLHPAATFLLGEAASRAGDPTTAEKHYQELAERHPDSEYVPAARHGLAWCAWQTQRPAETVKRALGYLQAHGDAEGADEIRVLLGEAFLETQKPREALAAYRQVEAREHQAAALRGAGFALAALEDHSGAAREFRALVKRFPRSDHVDEARLQAGVQTLLAGDVRAATKLLEQAAQARRDPEVLVWVARAHEEAGDPERALNVLDEARRASPEGELATRIQVARGDLLAQLGRGDDAVRAYEDGGSEYALYAAAIARLNANDHAGALERADELLRKYPEGSYRTAALGVRAEAQFAAGSYDAAQETFDQILASNPTDADAAAARARLAWCAYLEGRLDEAARRFAELVRRHAGNEESEEARWMLARIALESDDAEEARRASARYLERYPQGTRHADVLLLHARASNLAQARDATAELLRTHPDHPVARTARFELAERLNEAGELEDAEELYEALLKGRLTDEFTHRARYGLAWCRFEAQDFLESARHLEQLGRDETAPDDLRAAAWELALWSRSAPLMAAGKQTDGKPRAADLAQGLRATKECWRQLRQLTGDERRLVEAALRLAAAARAADAPEVGAETLAELGGTLRDPVQRSRLTIEEVYLALERDDLEGAEQLLARARRGADAALVGEAAFFIGEARFEQGDDEGAIAHYRLAAEARSPVRADALYKLGYAQLRTRDLGGAEASFRRLVEEHAESELVGEARFLLAETHFRRERWADAAQALERLVREAPDHEVVPKALFRLGLALGHLERWPAAEEVLGKLAREYRDFPNLAEAELWRGRALAEQSKARPARAAFERVLSLDKGELAAQARLQLGGLLEDQGRPEEALSEYLKVALLYAHEQAVAEALLSAGRCLEALDDAEKARSQYRELLEKHPRSPFAAQARARLEALDR